MITLQDYIDALIGSSQDYVQLSRNQTKLVLDELEEFQKVNTVFFIDFHQKYVLENNNNTLFPGTHIILPSLHPDEKRLWYRDVWEKTNGEEAKKEHKKYIIMQMLKEELNK